MSRHSLPYYNRLYIVRCFLIAIMAILLPSIGRAQSYALKTLYTFNGSDNEFPSGLTIDAQGNLYGTALLGGPTGSDNNGIVFKYSATGVFSTLAVFDGLDGDEPDGLLFIDAAGNLWGTTYQGGVDWHPEINHFGLGTVYKISATGVFTPGIVEFTGPHGDNPIGRLTQDLMGNLVGATWQGGAPWDPSLGDFGSGTVFRIAPSGVVDDNVKFAGGDGGYPSAGLTRDSQGNLYGTTYYGGAHAEGSIYKISPSGVFTTLASFNGVNGKLPMSSIVIDAAGNLYGTTYLGGITAVDGAHNGYGTIWKYSPTSGLTSLASFNGDNGMFPYYGLTMDAQGNLFGSTVYGGPSGNGVAFEYSANGVLSTLVNFDGPNNGAAPRGQFVLDSRGNLYGVANLGGANGYGTLFTIQPVNTTLTVASIAVNPTSVQGGGTVQGTVSISGPAPAGGMVVTLGSNNSQVTPKGPVTIPAGATSATFAVSTQPVTDNTTVAISARVGSSTQQTLFTVTPPTTTALALFQVNPDVIQGGQTSTATITLNRISPPGGTVVSLSSDSPLAKVPVSLTIPAGQLAGNFTITTQPVSTGTSVTLTATLGSSSLQYFPLISPPLPYAVGNLSIDQATVQGGTLLTGRILISRPATAGGISVALSSNSPSAVVPASIIVPEGVGIVSFPITTTAVTSDTVATIKATLGTSSLQTSASILAPRPTSLTSFTLRASSVQGGSSAQGTVTIGDVAPAGGVVITLSNVGNVVGMPASVGIAPGETSVTFAITTKKVMTPTSAIITVTAGSSSLQNQLTITPAGPAATVASVTLNPTSVVGGNSSTGTVTLSAVAPIGGVVVQLANTGTAASVPASVTIPPNSISATFPVTTQAVTATTTSTITATVGTSSQQAILNITPPNTVSLASLSLNPTTVRSGSSSQGTVTLSGPAPSGGAVITLSCSNRNVASVPASVTIAAGKTSATFTVTTTRQSTDNNITISANYNGATKNLTLTVTKH